jgi:protein-disulfide isomerase-like protein with CxxC motif
MAVSTGLEVVEYTDPLCPWAWGSEPKFRRLRASFGPQVPWRRCFGILFDDDDDPAPDEAAETRWYERHLAEIAGHTGAQYPAVLERVARTSRPASRAVIAAGEQGAAAADRALRRLRETLFRTGFPPDTVDRVRACLADLPDLDVDRLIADQASQRVHDRLERDRAETRTPVAELDAVDDEGPHPGRSKEIDGGRRYAFPTLLFVAGDAKAVVAGWRPLQAYLDAADVTRR